MYHKEQVRRSPAQKPLNQATVAQAIAEYANIAISIERANMSRGDHRTELYSRQGLAFQAIEYFDGGRNVRQRRIT